MYTVLTGELLLRCQNQTNRATDNLDLLQRLYDPLRIARHDFRFEVEPHFKVTSITQVLKLFTPQTPFVAEVEGDPSTILERECPGHRDGVSDFTTYEGLCVASIKIQRNFNLRDETDILELKARGLFERTDLFSKPQVLSTWLLKSEEYDLYYRLQSEIPQDHGKHLKFLAGSGEESRVREWLTRIVPTFGTLCEALRSSAGSSVTDMLLNEIIRHTERNTGFGEEILDTIAIRRLWNWVPKLAGAIITNQQLDVWLRDHIDDIPTDYLKEWLTLFYPGELPDGLLCCLVMHHQAEAMSMLLRNRPLTQAQAEKLVSLSLLVGFEYPVSHLDPDEKIRQRLRETQHGQSYLSTTYSRPALETAIKQGHYYAATMHDIPEIEQRRLNIAVIKAVEKGYLGIVRWLDHQGINVRPHHNITSRTARARGFNTLADYLSAEPPRTG